eukprot:6615315-Lingulodinium_polyedra.AAC.1
MPSPSRRRRVRNCAARKEQHTRALKGLRGPNANRHAARPPPGSPPTPSAWRPIYALQLRHRMLRCVL